MHNADYKVDVEVYLKRASNSHAGEVDLIKTKHYRTCSL